MSETFVFFFIKRWIVTGALSGLLEPVTNQVIVRGATN